MGYFAKSDLKRRCPMPWLTFRQLVRLRYQLLWAQARSNTGKAIMFIALYVIGAMIILFLSLGGFAAAIAAVGMGRGEQMARGILGGIFLVGMVAGTVLGAGPHLAFSDTVLRRYPLTSRGRLAARHVTGMLDPIWPFLLAMALGLAAGFAFVTPWRMVAGLPTAVLYLACTYLATVILLSLIERVLQYRYGATVLGAIALILSTAIPLAQLLLVGSHRQDWWYAIDRLLRFLPPGAAASLIAGTGLTTRALDLVALISWCLILVCALAFLERQPPVTRSETRAGISWNSPYDRLAGLFGRRLAPLVAKALRYHLRCNQVRFGLPGSLVFMVLMPRIMPQRHGSDAVFLTTLVSFFMAGYAATNIMTLNHFGWDGAGIRRYLLMPFPFVHALRADSFASLLIGGSVILPGLALCATLPGLALDARMVFMLLFSSAAGLFYHNALGLWTTTLFPWPASFGSVFGHRPPQGTNVVNFLAILVPMTAMAYLRENGNLPVILHFWWFAGMIAVMCAGAYVLSLHFTGSILESHREHLVHAIAGKNPR